MKTRLKSALFILTCLCVCTLNSCYKTFDCIYPYRCSLFTKGADSVVICGNYTDDSDIIDSYYPARQMIDSGYQYTTLADTIIPFKAKVRVIDLIKFKNKHYNCD